MRNRLPLFKPLQFFRDVYERFVQRFEGARGPFVARPAEFLQAAKILGERRDRRDVGARRQLRRGVPGIGLHERCSATGFEQMMLERNAGESSKKSGNEMPFRSQDCKQARLFVRSEAFVHHLFEVVST